MTEYEKRSIRLDAERAFRLGQRPIEACPYSFYTLQGLHWVACYWCTGLL